MVSTDGGKTYTALAGDNTVDGPHGPALNGTTSGFGPQTSTCPRTPGKKMLLGFRYVSDGGVNEGGWYVDDVTVGGTPISDGTSPAPFESTTEIRPTPVRRLERPAGRHRRGKHRSPSQIEFTGQLRMTRQLELAAAAPTRGGRHRGVRRADRADPAVRAVRADRQRRGAARWRQLAELIRTQVAGHPPSRSTVGAPSALAGSGKCRAGEVLGGTACG